MTNGSELRIFPCWRRFAVLAVLLALASLLPPTAFEWSRSAIAGGEYWRLLTGHWVHLGINHLLLNLGGLLITGLLFTRHPPLGFWLGYLIVSPLAISAGLLIVAPELTWYRGFSGCLHGLLVFTALFNLQAVNLQSDARWSVIVLAFLALKLLLESFLYPATGVNPLIGGAVITQSHWLGALAGAIGGVLLLLLNASGHSVRE